MRSDRELLQMAAKAAGMENHTILDDLRCVYRKGGVVSMVEWNPLADDGDALRLATKLYLMVDIRDDGAHTFVLGDYGLNTDELHGDDSGAATRRAIVRAAAEIGSHPKQHNRGE